MHSCLEPKTQASPVGAGGKRRHPRAHENSMPSNDRALHALCSWLDSWSGIEHAVVGMHRQGYDLQLTQYDDRDWRATFYTTGMEHSPTSASGTGWERTPWHATWAALKKGGRPMMRFSDGCRHERA
jgi:hypothetical protein